VRPLERISRVDSPDSVRNWRPAERRVRNERPTVRAVTREVAEDSVERTGRQAERRTIRERQDYMRARTPQVREPRVSPVPAEGTQPPVRVATRDRDRDGRHWRDGDRDGSHWRGDRDRNHHRWSGDWRNDHRYDWRHYRDRNRSIFRIGVYFDPFGWNYRRYNVGWRLWPSYYSSRYWLNDPWMYRLPYAPPGYRWIRYYDDAVLVDTWDGQIVDVIHNFFW
jgi:Ni/Co efflux regulator RcnB